MHPIADWQYKEEEGEICPVCGKDNGMASFRIFYQKSLGVTVNCECVECKSSWIECLAVDRYEDLIIRDQSQSEPLSPSPPAKF